jgi:hypothetical protein
MGMKVNEFEAKLATVSDTKLRRMLAESRAKGPEIVVPMLIAEAKRRGLDPDAPAPAAPAVPAQSGVPAEGFFPDNGPKYVPPEERGPSAGMAPETAGLPGEAQPGVPAGDAEAPANAGAWLHEEANQGLPMVAKILIGVAVLGGIAGGLFYFLNKGG